MITLSCTHLRKNSQCFSTFFIELFSWLKLRVLIAFAGLILCTTAASWPPSESEKMEWSSFSNNLNLQAIRQFLEKLIRNNERVSVWVNMVVNHHGETLLHHAAAAGEAPVVALLLSHGAHPDATSFIVGQNTPLGIAIRARRWVIVYLLLTHGANLQNLVHSIDPQEIPRNFLRWLEHVESYSDYHQLSRCRRLLMRLTCGMTHSHLSNPYQESPLHIAARTGCTESVVHQLSQHPQQLLAQRADGCTPVHVAILHGQLNALALLLSHFCLTSCEQSALYLRNQDGQTPAQLSETTAMCAYLSDYLHIGSSPLHVAIYQINPTLVSFLLHEPTTSALVNYQRRDGMTPLHIAVLMNHPVFFASLILANANPEIEDGNQQTPLALILDQDSTHHYIIQWGIYLSTGLYSITYLECLYFLKDHTSKP